MILNKYPSAQPAPTFLNETEKDQSIKKLYYTTIAEHQNSSTKQIFKFLEFKKNRENFGKYSIQNINIFFNEQLAQNLVNF